MGKIDEAYVEVTAKTQGLDKGLTTSQQKIEKFISNTNSMFAALGIAGVGAGVVGFLKSAVMAASNLSETMNKVKEVFGSSSSIVTGMADQMAQKFGLVRTTVLDAAANLGLVAQGAGMSAEASANLATTLTKYAADASSFFNVDMAVALEKIRSGLVGEAEPLRAFGVLLSEAAVKQEALKMGLTATNRELTEQEKVMARASLIMQGLNKASGDLERTQNGLANAIRRVEGEWENFKAEVGAPAAGEAANLLLGWRVQFKNPWAWRNSEIDKLVDKEMGIDKGMAPDPQTTANLQAASPLTKRQAWFRQRFLNDQAMWAQIAEQQAARNRVAPASLFGTGIGGMGSALTWAAMFAQQDKTQATWSGGHLFGGGADWAKTAQEHLLGPEKEQLEVAKSALEELKLINEGVSRINAEAKPGVILKGRE